MLTLISASLIGTSGIIALADEAQSQDEEAQETVVAEEEQAETNESSTNQNGDNTENEQKTADKEDSEDEELTKEESSDFIMPAQGEFTSPYGERVHPITHKKKLHAGIDIGGGGSIVAAQNGKVVEAQYDPGWGNYVKIDHGNGIETLYAHLQHDSTTVSEGDTVSKDQQIGTMGTTGSSTGVHLHFEVYEDGSVVDPAPYLKS